VPSNSAEKPVAFPVPLNDFDAAFDDAPADNAKDTQARKALCQQIEKQKARDRKDVGAIVSAQLCPAIRTANCNGYASGRAHGIRAGTGCRR